MLHTFVLFRHSGLSLTTDFADFHRFLKGLNWGISILKGLFLNGGFRILNVGGIGGIKGLVCVVKMPIVFNDR